MLGRLEVGHEREISGTLNERRLIATADHQGGLFAPHEAVHYLIYEWRHGLVINAAVTWRRRNRHASI